MKLSEAGLKNREEWINAGYVLPEFNRSEVIQKTKDRPTWVHFGIGNIFRAFQCNIAQKLLDEGAMDTGIIAAEGYDDEIVRRICRKHDNYSILVTLQADGNLQKKVIGSITESLTLNNGDFQTLKSIFSAESLQLASFTITEKGYFVDKENKTVQHDLEKGPDCPESYMGKIAALLYERYVANELPIAMVSMDNCANNGDKLKNAVLEFAEAWDCASLIRSGFLDYINDTSKVSFPRTMIDKITPRPDKAVLEILEKDGVEEQEPVITQKNTYIAPFVNAEQVEYLVIQDCFPNGRPPLELARVIFTDKNTVDKVEKMKVSTCLNPLHTALAVFGCLLGYKLIADEMKNSTLKKLVERIGYEEGLPVVTDPEIIDPKSFLQQVIQSRIPNPFMPDTPARIATDTSQKLAVRFGETIKAYTASGTMSASHLKMIPLVFAGWLRYLMGIDDNGEPFELSPDPLLPQLTEYVKDIKLGDSITSDYFEELYCNSDIFGENLFATGLADSVTTYFNEMIKTTGSVNITLEKYVN